MASKIQKLLNKSNKNSLNESLIIKENIDEDIYIGRFEIDFKSWDLDSEHAALSISKDNKLKVDNYVDSVTSHNSVAECKAYLKDWWSSESPVSSVTLDLEDPRYAKALRVANKYEVARSIENSFDENLNLSIEEDIESETKISVREALKKIVDKFGDHKNKYEVTTESCWDGSGWEGDVKHHTFYAPNDYMASFYMLLNAVPKVSAFEEFELTGDEILDYLERFPEVSDIADELHSYSLAGNEDIVIDLINKTTGEVLAHHDTDESEWDEDDSYDWDDDLDESIVESLADVPGDDVGNTEKPAYAAAVRDLKKADKAREEARKLPEAPKHDEKPKNPKMVIGAKKMKLDEALFEDVFGTTKPSNDKRYDEIREKLKDWFVNKIMHMEGKTQAFELEEIIPGYDSKWCVETDTFELEEARDNYIEAFINALLGRYPSDNMEEDYDGINWYERKHPKKTKNVADKVYDALDKIGYNIFASSGKPGYRVSSKHEEKLAKAIEIAKKFGLDYDIAPSQGRYHLTIEIPVENEISA